MLFQKFTFPVIAFFPLLLVVACTATPNEEDMAATSSSENSLTIVSWGGIFGKSQLEAYHKPFEIETGITINSLTYPSGMNDYRPIIRSQVRSGNVSWDIVNIDHIDAIQGCDEGLFETIDPSILPSAPDGTLAKQDFIVGTINKCSVTNAIWSTIFVYDKTNFSGAAPTTISDFFDVVKFPGKRGMRRNPKKNLEFALMADGVPAKDVYAILGTKEGLDRAFSVMDRIKKDVIWWSAGAQPQQMLENKEVIMTTAYNGRVFAKQIYQSKPYEIIWDGQIYDFDQWAIPKGTKRLGNALKFIAYATDTKRQADQTKYIAYGPARASSIAMIGKHLDSGEDMLLHIPTSPKNFRNALRYDVEWWDIHDKKINKRFTDWWFNE